MTRISLVKNLIRLIVILGFVVTAFFTSTLPLRLALFFLSDDAVSLTADSMSGTLLSGFKLEKLTLRINDGVYFADALSFDTDLKSWDRRHIEFRNLHITNFSFDDYFKTSAHLIGTLNLTNNQFQLNGRVTTHSPAGEIKSKASAMLNFSAPEVYTFSLEKIRGKESGFEVAGNLYASYLDNTLYFINDSHVLIDNNKLILDGSLGQQSNLHIDTILNLEKLDPLLQGSVHLSSQITGDLASPDIQSTITTKSLQYDDLLLRPIQVDLNVHALKTGSIHIKPFSLKRTTEKRPIFVLKSSETTFSYTNQHLELNYQVNLVGGDTITGSTEFDLSKNAIMAAPIKAKFHGNLNSDHTLPLLSDLITKASGNLLLDVGVTGSLSSPNVHSKLKSDQLSLVMPTLGIKPILQDFALVTQSPNHFTLSGKVLSGKGAVDVTGGLTLFPQPTLNLDINGQNFLFQNTPEISITMTPKLHLEYVQNLLSLKGEIKVPTARITPSNFNNAVTASSDVVIVNQDELASDSDMKSKLALQLILGNDIRFDGFNLEAQLTGKLDITSNESGLTIANGRINLLKGNYHFYGEDLIISDGQLRFTQNPISNPNLSIQAYKKVKIQSIELTQSSNLRDSIPNEDSLIDGKVGVHVTGTIRSPKLTLFSNPKLNEPDILSYLTLGVSSSNINQAQSQILSRAVSEIVGGGSLTGEDGPLQALYDLTSLDEINIESSRFLDRTTNTTRSQTALVLGKKLTPEIYLNYSIGLIDPINILQVQWRFSKRWRLQTETTSTGQGGGDLIFSIEK